MKVRNVKGVEDLEGIRVDNAVRQDLLIYDQQQGPGVRDNGGKDFASVLEKPEDSYLPLAPPDPSCTVEIGAEATLVGQHLVGQLIAGLPAGVKSSQTHEETNCCVGLHPDQPPAVARVVAPATNRLMSSLCCRKVRQFFC